MLSFAVAAAIAASTAPVCDRPGWDRLRAMVGHWRVDFSFRTHPGVFEKGTATSLVTYGSASCSIIDQVQGELAGKPMQFLSVMTITPDGAVERAYMDSEHGRLLHYRGAIDGDSMALMMDYPQSTSFASRAQADLSNPDKPIVAHLLSIDGGRNWQTVLTFRYQRAT